MCVSNNCPICSSPNIFVACKAGPSNFAEVMLMCEDCGEDWWESEDQLYRDPSHAAMNMEAA